MPATGFTPIQLFHSSTSGTLPTTSQLFTGEIFWNIADNKVYGLNTAGSALQTIVGSLGNQNANTVAITGGSINGTLIGNTTPSTGVFTTLVANTSVLSSIVGAGTGSNLSLQANATTYATLNTSGNLGLGVTPSAWSGAGSVIQISNSFVRADSNTLGTGNNTYFNGSNYIYQTTGYATLYNQITNQGQHQWFTAPSGTAGNPVTFTQAMTLTNSGYLGIGTTNPATPLHVYGSITDNTSGSYSQFAPTGLGALVGSYGSNNTANLWLSGGTGNNGNQVGHYINSVMSGNGGGGGSASLQIGQLAWSGTAFTSGSPQITLNSLGNVIFTGTITAAELATTQTPTASITASNFSVPIVLNGTTYYIRLSSTP